MEESGPVFRKEITIHVKASKVWKTWTDPELMKQWMAEEEAEIITDWKKLGASDYQRK